MSFGGVVGLCAGSCLSYFLRPKFRRIDPIICGGALTTSSILMFISLVIVCNDVKLAYVTIFLGMVFLNMIWAVGADMNVVGADNVLITKFVHFRQYGQ